MAGGYYRASAACAAAIPHYAVARRRIPKANVLWAGVKPSEALDSTARRVRQALSAAEIPFDRQDFNPHITLIRKPSVPEHVILSEIKIPRATMIVQDLCLYRSDHGESGMEYTVIGRSKSALTEA